jgi:lauroyl/myristoyl acyltransferase
MLSASLKEPVNADRGTMPKVESQNAMPPQPAAVSARTRLMIVLFSIVKSTLRLLPGALLVRLGASAGRFLGLFCRRELEISCAQLRLSFPFGVPRGKENAPASGSHSVEALEVESRRHSGAIRKLAVDVFGHAGESVAELIIIDRLLREKPSASHPVFPHIDAIGDDVLLKPVSQGRGAVALSGHLGCFELLAAYYVRRGLPLSVVGRLPNYPSLESVLTELRMGYRAETIWRNDKDSIKKLIQSFRQARCTAVLIDQDTDLENSFSSFFGLQAASPLTLVRLALRYRLLITTSFIVRTGHLRHQVITEEIPHDPEDPQAAEKILDVFNMRLEKLIRAYPEQWFWWHRRWRRRPGVDYRANPLLLPSTAQYLQWLNSDAWQERHG